MNRNLPCWCGVNCKLKQCNRPSLCAPGLEPGIRHLLKSHQVIIKTASQIEGIRKSCHLAARILDATCRRAEAGVTLRELNTYAHQLHLDVGARPAPLGYGHPPFPASICTSINNIICHGIPDGYVLREGDILNIDVSCEWQGYFGDCSRMVCIGKIDPLSQLVVDVSYECLMQGIARVRPGAYISEIGDAITNYAHAHGCSVVDVFVAHGVGVHFHEGPEVPHHRTQMHLPIVPGMTFTIEPMINAGVKDAVIDTRDGWTARTKDGKPSAQWEHALLVTTTGVEILTPWKRGSWLPLIDGLPTQ